MSTFPTLLAPWYVVQRLKLNYNPESGGSYEQEYYRENEDGGPMWSTATKNARLFMSLPSAARVARATAAEVRVLTSKEDLDEFRPQGDV